MIIVTNVYTFVVLLPVAPLVSTCGLVTQLCNKYIIHDNVNRMHLLRFPATIN